MKSQVFIILIIHFVYFINLLSAQTRIKDIVDFEGVRDNMLIGYGLVVGLNGTGDNLKNAIFTEKGLNDFLQKLGINTNGSNLKTKNVAAVMVTAILPAFVRSGSRIDITVSTIGDAKSLKAGTLLATTLLGADGEVYAIAQGPISIGSPSDSSDKNAKFSPTSGYINSGAIVEREIDFSMNSMRNLKIALKHPDITTARAIATAINSEIVEDCAIAEDPGTVMINIPKQFRTLNFLADIESINIEQDMPAKIIIDEATGTIVIGQNATISPVAVSHGSISLQVTEDGNFINNITDQKVTAASKPGTKIARINSSTSLSDVVEGLNLLGVTTKDLRAILEAIRKAGALQAIIEVR